MAGRPVPSQDGSLTFQEDAMPKIIAAVVVSLIAGFAAGAWLTGDDTPAGAADSTTLPGGPYDPGAPLEERLLSLEQVIAEERQARLDLAGRIEDLAASIERIDAGGPRFFVERAAREDQLRDKRRQETRRGRSTAEMVQDFQARRLNQLVESGFSEPEARRVLRIESETRYQAMLAAWEAQRKGEPADPFSAMGGSQALLRAELGDSDYERFLRAQGAPTAVQVTQILDSSPASRAGLQPGDEILSYNGNRVFNVLELRGMTMQGRPGEDVIVEVNRDGVTMQLSLPRGPIGISGSNAGLRGVNWWGGG